MTQKLGLFLCTLLFIIYAGRFEVDLPEIDITVSSNSGITSFSGDVGGTVGSPALPFQKVTLLLPPNADPQTVSVTLVDVEEEFLGGTYDISPAQAPMLMGKELIPADISLIDGKNPEAYANNTFLPAASVSNVNAGAYRSYKTVSFLLSPFSYNAVTKELKQITNGKVAVSYSSTRNETAINDLSSAREKISKQCKNAEEVLSEYPAPTRAKSMYLIVTKNNIKSQLLNLDAFVEVKKGKGFECEVITETEFGNGADALRSWLQDNYQSKNIEYLLIIGTPDPQGGDIPMKVMYPMKLSEIGKEEYRDVPSDQYFAELTGNWDLNGNGIFGEGADCGSGGALSDPEIKVGRFPFDHPETIDEILQRSMDYETADEGSISWRKNMFQSVVKYDDQTSGDPMMDGIKGLSSEWSTKKLSQGQCSEQAVTNEWNSGTYGYKVWLTHGLWNMAQHIINSTYAKQLKKDNPCFVVMGSCLNARPRDGNLSATILTTAGIGCLAATQVSLYRPGEIYNEKQWYNQALLYHFSRLLIVEELTIGDIVSTMMSDLSIDYPGAGYNWWHNWPNFTIYGDPSLSITSCGAVEAETIEVTKPVKSAKWQQGTENSITWETNCSDDEVLSITLEKSSTKHDIAEVKAGEKSYSWTIPATVDPGSGYAIKVTKKADNEVSGTSAAFEITEADNTEYELTVVGGSGSGKYKSGTVIDIEADAPENGKMFDKWTGTGASSVKSSNSAKTTITMPAKDSEISATYMKIPPSSGNLVILNAWENESCDLSESSFDSSKVSSDTIVSMKMTVGVAPNDTTYPWCKVSTYLDGDFSKTKSIRIIYKSSCNHLLELPQKDLAESGASYLFPLPKSSDWKEITVAVDEQNFSQPDWVGDDSSLKKPLILEDLLGVSILSDNGQGEAADIEFKDITILGYEPKESIIDGQWDTSGNLISRLSNSRISLWIPQEDSYTITLLTINGRELFKQKSTLTKGVHHLPVGKMNISGQLLISKIESAKGLQLVQKALYK